jgi:hypothetical protein
LLRISARIIFPSTVNTRLIYQRPRLPLYEDTQSGVQTQHAQQLAARPLVIDGPGFRGAQQIPELVGLIDLAPTCPKRLAFPCSIRTRELSLIDYENVEFLLVRYQLQSELILGALGTASASLRMQDVIAELYRKEKVL